MPKGRFHELYQDYVCGCVLRVARELFALFPLETVLVTAVIDSLDARTGQAEELPVLSVAMPRRVVARLDFSRLDPSDAIENFQHRGDFKASRKSEAFQPIKPLTQADIAQSATEDMSFQELLANVQKTREQLRTELAALRQRAITAILQTYPST